MNGALWRNAEFKAAVFMDVSLRNLPTIESFRLANPFKAASGSNIWVDAASKKLLEKLGYEGPSLVIPGEEQMVNFRIDFED